MRFAVRAVILCFFVLRGDRYMEQSKRISRKVISVVLSLLIVFSCYLGLSLTTYAMDIFVKVVSEDKSIL